MARARVEYACRECGARTPRWMGRCPECQAWDSLVEQASSTAVASRDRPGSNGNRPVRLSEIRATDIDRVPLEMPELSRVLGGGIVRGSLVLIGGDPGVGKSTLLGQVSHLVARANGPVLYVSGEESLTQVGLRARRLGWEDADLLFLSDTDVDTVEQAIRESSPRLAVIDSIQSMACADVDSSPGSVSQLREATLRFMQLAKGSGTAIFLIGHVTKEGAIAGPKVLEHMVDTVLYLEGERYQAFRLLRSTKNRFGPTHEVGVFEMQGEGMIEVPNPSAAFLAERDGGESGSAVLVTMEGTRPLLVEVQALASRTALTMPRRSGNGVDFNRLLLACAVLSRRMGLPLHDQDVYVNVVGGMRVEEPAADLAVALAIISSVRDRPIRPGTAVVGEIGLGGEVRAVGQLELRVREAAKLGFERVVVPASAARRLPGDLGVEVIGVSSIREAGAAALVSSK